MTMKKQFNHSNQGILRKGSTRNNAPVAIQKVRVFSKDPEPEAVNIEPAPETKYDIEALKSEYLEEETRLKQDIDTKLQQYRSENQAQIDAQLAQHQTEFKQNLDQEKEDLLNQVRQDGLAAARAEIKTQYEGLLNDLSDGINDLAKKRNTDFEMDKKTILTLALSVAEKIVQKELDDAPERFLDIVDHALAKITDKDKVVIRVSMGDMELVQRHIPDIQAKMPDIKKVEAQADDRLLEGGCVVETSLGYVDSSLKTKLEMIQDAFFKILDEEASSPVVSPLDAQKDAENLEEDSLDLDDVHDDVDEDSDEDELDDFDDDPDDVDADSDEDELDDFDDDDVDFDDLES